MSKKFRYDHSSTIIDYMETYFKKKPKDCILYSEDGTGFEIHKELFGQTEFMRKLLKSAKDYGSTSVVQWLRIQKSSFLSAMIHYLKNKVGLVDFANAHGVVMF